MRSKAAAAAKGSNKWFKSSCSGSDLEQQQHQHQQCSKAESRLRRVLADSSKQEKLARAAAAVAAAAARAGDAEATAATVRATEAAGLRRQAIRPHCLSAAAYAFILAEGCPSAAAAPGSSNNTTSSSTTSTSSSSAAFSRSVSSGGGPSKALRERGPPGIAIPGIHSSSKRAAAAAVLGRLAPGCLLLLLLLAVACCCCCCCSNSSAAAAEAAAAAATTTRSERARTGERWLEAFYEKQISGVSAPQFVSFVPQVSPLPQKSFLFAAAAALIMSSSSSCLRSQGAEAAAQQKRGALLGFDSLLLGCFRCLFCCCCPSGTAAAKAAAATTTCLQLLSSLHPQGPQQRSLSNAWRCQVPHSLVKAAANAAAAAAAIVAAKAAGVSCLLIDFCLLPLGLKPSAAQPAQQQQQQQQQGPFGTSIPEFSVTSAVRTPLVAEAVLSSSSSSNNSSSSSSSTAASYCSSSSSSSSSMTADMDCCMLRQQQLCTSDAAAAGGGALEVPASPSVLLSPPPSPPSPRVELRCSLKQIHGHTLQQQQQQQQHQQQQFARQQQQQLWQHEQLVVDALLESEYQNGCSRLLLSSQQLQQQLQQQHLQQQLQQQQQHMQAQRGEDLLRLRQMQLLQQPQQLLHQQQQVLLQQAAAGKTCGVSAEVLAQLLGSSSAAAGQSTWGTRCSTPGSPLRAAAAAGVLEKEAAMAAAAAVAAATEKETHLKGCLQRVQQAAAAAAPAAAAPTTPRLAKGTHLRVQDCSKSQQRSAAAAAAATAAAAAAAAAAGAGCSSYASEPQGGEEAMDVCEQAKQPQQDQEGAASSASSTVAPRKQDPRAAELVSPDRQQTAAADSNSRQQQRAIHCSWGVCVCSGGVASRLAQDDELAVSLYRGPPHLPPCQYRRLYDPEGPLQLPYPPLNGGRFSRAELRLWPRESDRVISQNSSRRKVHRACWLSPLDPSCSFPVAVKFVDDGNLRDGRSIKREIECHLYIYQRLGHLQRMRACDRQGDAWPCAELYAYYLDRKDPGQSVLITRKLSGPDFFDVIRTEHSSAFNPRTAAVYEQHKLHWCCLAMERIAQYARLGIRHNDIKPDNIVLDFFAAPNSSERLLDVKLIDLGTASLHSAKDFTGGTSWYESPEQKMLEFYTKKQRDLEVARQVVIGLPSDAWGAGLSITEVLMGRRVVDVLRAPGGPGPLEFRGSDGWAVHPEVWVACARRALGLDREQQRFPICTEAARLVFEMLVKPEPSDRATVEEVIPHLKRFAEAGFLKAVRRYNASGGAAGVAAAAAAAASTSSSSSSSAAACAMAGAAISKSAVSAGVMGGAGGCPAAAEDAASPFKQGSQFSEASSSTRCAYTNSHRSNGSSLAAQTLRTGEGPNSRPLQLGVYEAA
ncbi:hypothetical protein ACSSS7_000661 [Eimeria intestinalis]